MNKKNFLFFILFIFNFSYALEPSAFELQSGATKKDIKTLKDASSAVSNSLITFQERIMFLESSLSGLKSVIEGQVVKAQENATSIANNIKKIEINDNLLKILNDDIEEIKTSIETLKTSLDSQITTYNAAISDFNDRFNRLKDFVNDMNAKTVDALAVITDELTKQAKSIEESNSVNKQILEILNKPATSVPAVTEVSEAKGIDPSTTSTPINQTVDLVFDKDINNKRKIYKDAVELFYKQSYEAAKNRFLWLREIAYRSAAVEYYLGQIAFLNKNYDEAIVHFKNSVSLNDKAKYMPKLLLDTSRSFMQLKDYNNSKIFIESLIKMFPDSKEAKIAQDDIVKINQKLKEKQ